MSELQIGFNRPTGVNILENYNNDEFLANSTLPKDAYIQIEEKITPVADKTLQIFNELTAAGLQVGVDGIGISQYEYQTHSNMTDARVSMSMPTKSENDQPEYLLKSVPLPIISKDFVLDPRIIAASRRNSDRGIDTIAAEEAVRVVGEAIENICLVGSDNVAVEVAPGNIVTLKGMTNFPGVNSYTIPTTWTDPSADIIADVKAMIDIMRVANYRRGLRLRVSDNYWTKLQCDYSDVKGSETFRDRILRFAQIDSVEVTEFLPDDSVMLYAATPSAVVVPVASDIQIMEQIEGHSTRWSVWAAMTIAPKTDFNGQSGILYATV